SESPIEVALEGRRRSALARTVADLRELLRLDSRTPEWSPPIIKTIATKEDGIQELWVAIAKHRAYLEQSGELQLRRRKRVEQQILELALSKLREKILS